MFMMLKLTACTP